jgi:hypothetical protein
MHKFVQQCRVGFIHNERTRYTPLESLECFGSFCYYTNFSAKWAELVLLMHKFVHYCRVRILRNKTHPIHAIGPQTHVLGRFGSFHYSTNFSAKRAELVKLMHKFVQPSLVETFCNKTHLIHTIGPQTHVFGHFRSFCYWTNFSAKRTKLVQLMHKFVQLSRVGIFRNERT